MRRKERSTTHAALCLSLTMPRGIERPCERCRPTGEHALQVSAPGALTIRDKASSARPGTNTWRSTHVVARRAHSIKDGVTVTVILALVSRRSLRAFPPARWLKPPCIASSILSGSTTSLWKACALTGDGATALTGDPENAPASGREEISERACFLCD
jgi:hypothetical protein